MIKLILKGKPLSTQHIYAHRWRIKYMKKEAKELKEYYIQQIQEQYNWEILTNEVIITINLYFSDNRKRDRDNWHKLSMDALEWTVLENDCQIKKALVTVNKWDESYIDISIWDLI